MLSWVDEACWIAASLEYPDSRFVTVGMDHVEFRHGVKEGVILEIDCHKMKQGRTSVSYKVAVSRGGDKEKSLIFSTCVTFVNVDQNGAKLAIS